MCRTDPLAPMTTKKHCMTIAASASPLGARDPVRFGNSVAIATASRVMIGISIAVLWMPPGKSAGSIATTLALAAHTNALRVKAYDPFRTSKDFERRDFKITSALASSRASILSGSSASYPSSATGGSARRAREKSIAKYSAFMRLSAARPAATRFAGISNAPATAT